MSAESTSRLDRAALIVTYCDGIGCNGSTKGAVNMLNLGFRVKELMGGLDWWKRDARTERVHALYSLTRYLKSPRLILAGDGQIGTADRVRRGAQATRSTCWVLKA